MLMRCRLEKISQENCSASRGLSNDAEQLFQGTDFSVCTKKTMIDSVSCIPFDIIHLKSLIRTDLNENAKRLSGSLFYLSKKKAPTTTDVRFFLTTSGVK